MNIKSHKTILTIILGVIIAAIIGCGDDVSSGKFVAFGGNSGIHVVAYSADGVSWEEINSKSLEVDGQPVQLQDICYGDGKFVAVGYTEGTPMIGVSMHSTDGIQWSEIKTFNSTITMRQLNVVCYGNGKFVAIGQENDYPVCTTKAIYSYNGIEWRDAAVDFDNSGLIYMWDSICYGNGKFVAVGYEQNNSEAAIICSKDGINWSKITLSNGTGISWGSVCYGKGRFVALSISKAVAYSTDGDLWTVDDELSSDFIASSVCYGNGKFVAVNSAMGDTVPSVHSVDGKTWERKNNLDEAIWKSVCYGNGKFIAVPNNNTGDAAYSEDGINWKIQKQVLPPGAGGGWNRITYGLDSDIFGFL